MKEMVYSIEGKKEILDECVIDGFHYVILNLGWHPTAYVQIPKDHRFYKVEYGNIEEDVDVHGGLTYSGNMGKDGEWYLGWDYGHFGDFSGVELMYPVDLQTGGKKWTTEEILEDVKTAIRQLKEIK